ncbi:phospholipase D-like domain-containing protein DpdK [Kitasatospora cineracea]|uniref:Phospholipase D-like protein n=1 Tax=Kitasatospora cineracea TaxID=88074 RepID=A0A3N4REL7_9ACTN|nr:phospholipase D-like domain-containing protein DpdK [Kitasatospora cineracea]RPE31823.1 phospholipase D-like protein [Kitasatospora cineracea]
MRRIVTIGAGETRLLNDLLQNLLVSELLAPSVRFWVLSPWISDIPVIDNSAGQFKSVLPAMPARPIRLTEVLVELSRRGSDVQVVVRDDARNTAVVQRLTNLTPVGPHPTVHIEKDFHDKGMVSDRFHVHGSMNFTFFGKGVNQEGVTVVSDPDQIARAQITYQKRYQPS